MSLPVVVIGAGIIGCAVARELSARGIAVVVIDDRAPGGGATQASAGMLAPYVEAHESGPLRDLGVRSLDLYDDWIAAVRRDSDLDVEYRRIGTLEIALDPDHASELQRSAGTDDPVARVWLDAERARRTYPVLGSVAGALHTPVHGYVAAPQLTAALVAAAAARGVTFTRGRVGRLRRTAAAMEVETSEGSVRGSSVVLAAGAWINEIAVEGTKLPPLKPWRGQLLHLDWHGRPIETIVWGPECYIVPRLDGSLLVGATVEDVGFDERATAAAIRDLLDAACELLPEGWGATFLGVRVGLRPATPDELPVIGPDPNVDGLVHASGHFRNGVLLAPITAALIADWIEKRSADPVFDVLRADRFS